MNLRRKDLLRHVAREADVLPHVGRLGPAVDHLRPVPVLPCENEGGDLLAPPSEQGVGVGVGRVELDRPAQRLDRLSVAAPLRAVGLWPLAMSRSRRP